MSPFKLRFSIAGRTLLSKRLDLLHWNGFGKATTASFPQSLPKADGERPDGYIVHSAEIEGEPDIIHNDGNYLTYLIDTYPRYVTRFTGTFDEFLQGMSAKSRSTLRRKVKKFAKAGNAEAIDWRTYSTGSELAEFFDHAIPLAARTYQAKLFDGALPETAQFIEESKAAADRGALRAYLLFLNAQPVAYLYTPLEEGRFLYSYLGFDENAAHLSPGTVLQFLVHERLFAEKSADCFDFTEGDGPHKALFANESTQCATLLYLPATPAMRLLVRSHLLWNRTVSRLARLADKLKLRSRIRQLLR